MKRFGLNPVLGLAGVVTVGAAVLAATRGEPAGVAPVVAKAIPAARVVEGGVVPMGEGSIRSWVKLDGSGEPAAVGVTFGEAALVNLPTGGGKTCCDGPAFELGLPAMEGLVFTHVWVNWNPKGHEPAGMYDVPHFDFHFYMQGSKERELITAAGEDLAKCTKALGEGCVPAGYISPPGTSVPRMGAHWLPVTAPELHGGRFEKTFLYGAYDGRITFVEPMITKAYLEGRPDFQEKLVVPAKYPAPGFYPTTYSIRFDPVTREYTVALGGMERR